MSALYGVSSGNEGGDLDVFSDNEELDGGDLATDADADDGVDFSDNEERSAVLADA